MDLLPDENALDLETDDADLDNKYSRKGFDTRKPTIRSAIFLCLPIVSSFTVAREIFQVVLSIGFVGFTMDGLRFFRRKSRFLLLFFAITIVQLGYLMYAELPISHGTISADGGIRIVDPSQVAKSLNDLPWRKNVKGISIILAAHDENPIYLQQTIESIMASTSENTIEDIIIVDDASKHSVVITTDSTAATVALKPEVARLVHVIRNPTREGVARSRVIGAKAAKGIVYMFMDAHMKPEPGWLAPILRHLNANYKRVVAPILLKLDPGSWKNDQSAMSYKMLFNWDFDLKWFEDTSDEIPILSGGVFAITKEWWEESGGYDTGFEQYGMENLEISLRTWLCGGEIHLAKESKIGHLFQDAFSYANSELALMTNKVRAIELWVDEEHKEPFYAKHVEFKDMKSHLDLSEMEAIKKKLNCQPFSFFVHHFYDVFQMQNLVDLPKFKLKLGEANCLDIEKQQLQMKPCITNEKQEWAWIFGNGLYNAAEKMCIDAANPGMDGGVPVLFACHKGNLNQQWSLTNGRLQWGSFCLQVRGSEQTGVIEFAQCREMHGANIYWTSVKASGM
eukprot:GEMP01028428.1.p1 GENE.GEMP01028428.1~~GEMP01028428.1.p1  ORF type:complete len:566 (+),score=91.42 GEMP01028428.1:128-1825(+)